MLTCPLDICRHQADYTGATVSSTTSSESIETLRTQSNLICSTLERMWESIFRSSEAA